MGALSSVRWLPAGAVAGARRCPRAAMLVVAGLAAGALSPGGAVAGERFADRTLVLVGAGGGFTSVDLPDVDDPSHTFGSHTRVQLDLGNECGYDGSG